MTRIAINTQTLSQNVLLWWSSGDDGDRTYLRQISWQRDRAEAAARRVEGVHDGSGRRDVARDRLEIAVGLDDLVGDALQLLVIARRATVGLDVELRQQQILLRHRLHRLVLSLLRLLLVEDPRGLQRRRRRRRRRRRVELALESVAQEALGRRLADRHRLLQAVAVGQLPVVVVVAGLLLNRRHAERRRLLLVVRRRVRRRGEATVPVDRRAVGRYDDLPIVVVAVGDVAALTVPAYAHAALHVEDGVEVEVVRPQGPAVGAGAGGRALAAVEVVHRVRLAVEHGERVDGAVRVLPVVARRVPVVDRQTVAQGRVPALHQQSRVVVRRARVLVPRAVLVQVLQEDAVLLGVLGRPVVTVVVRRVHADGRGGSREAAVVVAPLIVAVNVAGDGGDRRQGREGVVVRLLDEAIVEADVRQVAEGRAAAGRRSVQEGVLVDADAATVGARAVRRRRDHEVEVVRRLVLGRTACLARRELHSPVVLIIAVAAVFERREIRYLFLLGVSRAGSGDWLG